VKAAGGENRKSIQELLTRIYPNGGRLPHLMKGSVGHTLPYWSPPVKRRSRKGGSSARPVISVICGGLRKKEDSQKGLYLFYLGRERNWGSACQASLSESLRGTDLF